jgi:hypothetical protein
VIGETEVVEFSGGGLLRKGETCVRSVSLATFENGTPAESVQHPITWLGLKYSDPLPTAVTVDRALWLVRHQPPKYQLGFRNCESIAVWCVSGDYESFQAKKFMRWKAPAIIPIAYAMRKKPTLGLVLGAGSIIISLMTEPVKPFETGDYRVFSASPSSRGLLIHATSGSFGGVGALLKNRSGCAA